MKQFREVFDNFKYKDTQENTSQELSLIEDRASEELEFDTGDSEKVVMFKVPSTIIINSELLNHLSRNTQTIIQS